MTRALAHRGPDGEGVAHFDAFDREGDRWQAAFGHRRLAVFDPSPTGGQPMRSRSGRSWIVMNGEVYNHPELRRSLSGFPWRSRSDTEVVLEMFERFGTACLSRLNGIFAFAVWDTTRRRLTLVRDRLGVKPLHYRSDKDGVTFASEMRGLLAGPRFRRALKREAFSAYLDFGFIPAPLTALDGVNKISPGEILEWCDGESRVSSWWSLPASDESPASGWRESLYGSLTDAVRIQLRSDVPVGAFLSGGVDSTLLTALAVRERGPIDTFSVGFPESRTCDESLHARAVARRLGTRHHEVQITSEIAGRVVPRLVAGMDEPFADSSIVPTYLLSEAARAEVTVALAGDGADELFAGYRRYGADRWLGRWRRIPSGPRNALLAPLLRALPEDRSTVLGDLVRRSRKVLDADGLDDGARAFALAQIFSEAEKRRVAPGLGESFGAGRDHFDAMRERHAGRNALDTQLRVDLQLGLPDDMLTKVDRASMAHGLEVRVPFLDHRFVEHVAALPSGIKRRAGRPKAALLDVFGAHIPAKVRRRSKRGFDAPMSDWLRGPLRVWLRDTLGSRGVSHGGLLDAGEIDGMLKRHEIGQRDESWRLWSLVVWVDWAARNQVT